MTPKEVNEKYAIKNRDVILKNGNGNTEPVQEILEVEGNFDKIVYNENGKFAGYLYNIDSSESKTDEDNKIRVYLSDGYFPTIDDLQFLLFKHIIVSGDVTVRPDMNPNDGIDTRELQIEVKADGEGHDIRVLGESTSRKWVVVKHDKHPHKRRELPEGPLNIAVISPAGSKGCNDFACVIDDGVYDTLNYFHPVPFSPGKIKEAGDDIVKKGEYNCLCIVRGGGPPESLAVFDYQGVVKCLRNARKTMYIVTGIGHSNDSTKCDDVADYCAYTPTDSAYFFSREK